LTSYINKNRQESVFHATNFSSINVFKKWQKSSLEALTEWIVTPRASVFSLVKAGEAGDVSIADAA